MADLRIPEHWLKGSKTPEEREQIKKMVLGSTNLLDKLREILYNMEEGKRGSVLLDYDTPSWSHKQAHLNGELAMIKKVIDLVTIKEREDHSTI